MPGRPDGNRLDSVGSEWVAGRASLRWVAGAGAEVNAALRRFLPVGKARAGSALSGWVVWPLAGHIGLLSRCRRSSDWSRLCRGATFLYVCRQLLLGGAIQWASRLTLLSSDSKALVALWEAPTILFYTLYCNYSCYHLLTKPDSRCIYGCRHWHCLTSHWG
jgi:hypothetical protein